MFAGNSARKASFFQLPVGERQEEPPENYPYGIRRYSESEVACLLADTGFQLLGRFDDKCLPVSDATPVSGDRHYLTSKEGIGT